MHTNLASARVVATAAGAIGIALWASETALITFTERLPPLQTVALAFMVAAALGPGVWWATGDSPRAALRLPLRVWLLTVGSLVGFHACIYYAVQNAPAAPAALLQGTTPLMIVLGSALLPGERLRWWHIAGAIIGLLGVISLIDTGEHVAGSTEDSGFYLALVGAAAAIWGVYSLLSRMFADVPSSAMGVFFAASAIVAGLGHLSLEEWVYPTSGEWAAIAALGILPMGIALYLWDFGLKKGDLQALGGISYFEPFLGALFVAVIGQGALTLNMLWAGALIMGGAALASLNVWRDARRNDLPSPLDEEILQNACRDFHAAVEFMMRFQRHLSADRAGTIGPDSGAIDARMTKLVERLADIALLVSPSSLTTRDAEILGSVTAEIQIVLASLSGETSLQGPPIDAAAGEINVPALPRPKMARAA